MRFRVGSPLQRPSAESTDKQAAGGSPEARRSRLASPAIAISYILPPAIALGIAVVAWEAWVRAAAIPVYIVPAPSAVFTRLAGDFGFFALHGGITLAEALAGFAARRCSGIHRRDPHGALTLPGAQPIFPSPFSSRLRLSSQSRPYS